MKKYLFITIIITGLFASCASNIIYLDSNNKKVTAKQFKALDKQQAQIVKIKNDTATIKRVFRKHIGYLDSVQHQQLSAFLTKIIGPEFNKNKNTMVHLYRENSSTIKKDAEHERYWSWVGANSATMQAFLIGTRTSGINPNKKKHIYLDPHNLLNNLFFSNSPFGINHFYLKPNGEIYIYYGGKDILGILDWSL